MTTTLFQNVNARVTYNPNENWLCMTFPKDFQTFAKAVQRGILIGPIGLIEAGIELVNTGLGRQSEEIYSHIDGAFYIRYDDGALYFMEGSKVEQPLLIRGPSLIALGVAMIDQGHYLRTIVGDGDEPRYGGRVAFGEGVVA